MKKIKVKNKIKILFFTFIIIFIFSPNIAFSETERSPDLNPLGQLQVRIPGIDELVERYPVVCEEDDAQTCKIPWVAIYIHAVYNYLIVIGGIVATIALMLGGVIWLMSAGNASRITEAKSWIGGSITGVLILLTSYVLLNHINPNLVGLRYIELETIERIIAGDLASSSNDGWEGSPFTANATAEHLTAIDIYCPQSGGSSEIKQIAESFKGKVVYRLGSKNGKGDEYNRNNAQQTYGLKCPNSDPWKENVVCYDCSGFIRQVLWCAGLEDPGLWTGTIFSGAEKIDEEEGGCSGDKINNIRLVPGDLVGWKKEDPEDDLGHVFIYIGDGMVADVWGARGYEPAKAYKSEHLCTALSKYEKNTLRVKRQYEVGDI
jgi:hypothetical protein